MDFNATVLADQFPSVESIVSKEMTKVFIKQNQTNFEEELIKFRDLIELEANTNKEFEFIDFTNLTTNQKLMLQHEIKNGNITALSLQSIYE